jgi:hypothetical protein
MAKKSNKNVQRAKNTPAKSKKKTVVKPAQRRKPTKKGGSTNTGYANFGPVSSINTAPLAIGNSLQGSKASVLHTANGCLVRGRDYCFTATSTGTVTQWCLCGGIPTAPYAFPSTVLRNISTMYNKYKLRAATVHYITSSPTSTPGDVMFYFRRNEGGSLPQPQNSAFLPYVLSDSLTVLGPQWTNHSASIEPFQNWLSTDYGATADAQEYNQYDIFLYSKTTSGSDSPGYVIIDYEYEFRELSINPRAGALSSVAGVVAEWNQCAISFSGAKTAATTTLTGMTFGTTGIGGITIAAPAFLVGDVLEIVLDVNNSSFTNTIATNFAQEQVAVTAANAQAFAAITISDGLVLYGVMGSATVLDGLFQSIDGVYAFGGALVAGASVTYSETIQCWIKRIGSVVSNRLVWQQ